jgi:4-hydroxy-tetrahydrodipicolinate synthase
MEFSKNEAKEWAKKNLKGLEAVLFPSFTPDLQHLDEAGIRYDVQHLADNGFKSALCAVEVCGMSFEERKKFIEIVCDEARGKIHTSVAVLQDTVEQDMEMLQHYEKAGGSVVMLGHPLQYYPRSEEEIYRMYKYVCDSTDLAVVFYPARLKTKSLHNSYWPMQLLPRIAEIPNIVALKIGGGSSLAFTAQCFHLVGDRLLVNDPIRPAGGRRNRQSAGYLLGDGADQRGLDGHGFGLLLRHRDNLCHHGQVLPLVQRRQRRHAETAGTQTARLS